MKEKTKDFPSRPGLLPPAPPAGENIHLHPRKPTPDDLHDLKARYGLTSARIGLLAGVAPRTVRAWLNGEYGIPISVWRLLRLLLGEATIDDILGEIEAIDNEYFIRRPDRRKPDIID